MQGIIVVQISNEGHKSETCEKQHENQEHPFLEELDREIEKLERISAEVTMRHAVISHIRDDIRKMLGFSEESDKTGKDEASDKPEEKTENPESDKNTASEISPDPAVRRIEILEDAVKDVVDKLGNANMTARFQQLSELHEKLKQCADTVLENQEPITRLVELESCIGEALEFLGTSKLAARFNLLKQLRQELGEALTNSRA